MEDIRDAESLDWKMYERELLTLCENKAEELALLGYDHVTANEVWNCVQAITKGKAPLNGLVAAIIGLNAGRFMNYMTMNAFQGKLADDRFDAGNPR